MLFGLLSVFSDAFEVEDAVFVAEAAGLTPVDVVTGLGSLVAKSLLSAQARGPSLRYRLLDSTRRYAAERRQADPACGQALRRHAQRVLALFEQSEEEWNWREPADWTQRYLGRIADLRAALSWAFGEEGDPVLGIRLSVSAITLWSETSILSEAQARLEFALALAKTIECDDLLRRQSSPVPSDGACFTHAKSRTKTRWPGSTPSPLQGAPRNLEYQQRALVGFAFYLLQIGNIPRAITYLEEAAELAERDRDLTATSEGDQGAGLGPRPCGRIDQKPPGSRSPRGDLFAGRGPLAQGRERSLPVHHRPLQPALCCVDAGAGRLCGQAGSRCGRRRRSQWSLGVPVECAGARRASCLARNREFGCARKLHRAAASQSGTGAHLALGSCRALFLRLPSRFARRSARGGGYSRGDR